MTDAAYLWLSLVNYAVTVIVRDVGEADKGGVEMTTPFITNEEDRGVSKMDTPSGTQQAHLINESSIQHSTAADLSLCPPSEPPLIRTLPHPHSHPVLWTVAHLIVL